MYNWEKKWLTLCVSSLWFHIIKKIRKFSTNQPKLGKESDNVNESSLCLTGKRTSERDDYVASSKSAIEGSCGLMEAKTRGSGNGFAVPQPKIIPWLASIRICLGLKGQVILRRLERIYRGSSRRRESRTRNAKDLLFRLNVPERDSRRYRERSRRTIEAKLLEGKASFDARTIKVEGTRNHQRMLSYGFLIRIQFKPIRLRDSSKAIGIIADNRVSWSLVFLNDQLYRG